MLLRVQILIGVAGVELPATGCFHPPIAGPGALEGRIVLVVAQDAFAGMFSFELSQTLRQLVFFKASSTAGSVSG